MGISNQTVEILKYFTTDKTSKEFIEDNKNKDLFKGLSKKQLISKVYILCSNGHLNKTSSGYITSKKGMTRINGDTTPNKTKPLAKRKKPSVQTSQNNSSDNTSDMNLSSKQETMLFAVRDALEEQQNLRQALLDIQAICDKYLNNR